MINSIKKIPKNRKRKIIIEEDVQKNTKYIEKKLLNINLLKKFIKKNYKKKLTEKVELMSMYNKYMCFYAVEYPRLSFSIVYFKRILKACNLTIIVDKNNKSVYINEICEKRKMKNDELFLKYSIQGEYEKLNAFLLNNDINFSFMYRDRTVIYWAARKEYFNVVVTIINYAQIDINDAIMYMCDSLRNGYSENAIITEYGCFKLIDILIYYNIIGINIKQYSNNLYKTIKMICENILLSYITKNGHDKRQKIYNTYNNFDVKKQLNILSDNALNRTVTHYINGIEQCNDMDKDKALYDISSGIEKIPFYCFINDNIGKNTKEKITHLIDYCDDLINLEEEIYSADKNKWINKHTYKIIKPIKTMALKFNKIIDYVMELNKLNNILITANDYYKYENKKYENMGYIYTITNICTKEICYSLSTTGSIYTILIKFARCIELNKGRFNMDEFIIRNKNNLSDLLVDIIAYIKFTNRSDTYTISHELQKNCSINIDKILNEEKYPELNFTERNKLVIKYNEFVVKKDTNNIQNKYNKIMEIYKKIIKDENFVDNDNKYSKSVIYAISKKGDKLNKCYIGSTTQLVHDRIYQHIDAKLKNIFIGIKSINDFNEKYIIHEVEKYPCNNKYELQLKEDYWIARANSIKYGFNSRYNYRESRHLYKHCKYKDNDFVSDLNKEKLVNAIKMQIHQFEFMQEYLNNPELKCGKRIISLYNITEQKYFYMYIKNCIYDEIIDLYANSKHKILINTGKRPPRLHTFHKVLCDIPFKNIKLNIVNVELNEVHAKKTINKYCTQCANNVYNIPSKHFTMKQHQFFKTKGLLKK